MPQENLMYITGRNQETTVSNDGRFDIMHCFDSDVDLDVTSSQLRHTCNSSKEECVAAQNRQTKEEKV